MIVFPSRGVALVFEPLWQSVSVVTCRVNHIFNHLWYLKDPLRCRCLRQSVEADVNEVISLIVCMTQTNGATYIARNKVPPVFFFYKGFIHFCQKFLTVTLCQDLLYLFHLLMSLVFLNEDDFSIDHVLYLTDCSLYWYSLTVSHVSFTVCLTLNQPAVSSVIVIIQEKL